MNFRTKILIENSLIKLNYSDKILLLGSCFSENLGCRLHRSKFQVMSNSLGIVFNPVSIQRQISYCLGQKDLNSGQLEYNDALWHHFDFHGRYSHPSKEHCLEGIEDDLKKTKYFIEKCKIVYITFGTANVYERVSSKEVVANNHKFPIDAFTKRRLKIDEVSASMHEMLMSLRTLNPNIKVVFTISPVRYLRDGFEENQRSKSVLLLAVDEMLKERNVFYFPSYEIFMDDLRDYRYYDKDLSHPSQTGVDYVWEVFKTHYFDKDTMESEKEIESFVRSVEHRPIHPQSQNHKAFRSKLKNKAKQLSQIYPQLSFQNEIDVLERN